MELMIDDLAGLPTPRLSPRKRWATLPAGQALVVRWRPCFLRLAYREDR